MYYSGLGERFFRNKRLMLTRYKHKGLYLNDIIRLGTKANPYLYMEVKRDSQSVLKLVERCEKSEQKCIDLANQVERIAELV